MATSPLRNQPAEIDPFELPVHPAANVFPMLPPDELQELAEDIKAHGLREPIVAQQVDGKAVLLDGRNRRAACQMVGITPALKWLKPDEDPVQFIYSSNVARRHLTKGQKAMAIALMFPEPTKYKQGGANHSFVTKECSEAHVSKARLVQQWMPELVADVQAGGSLESAYKKAVEQRDQGNPDRAQRKKPRPPKASKPAGNLPPDGSSPKSM